MLRPDVPRSVILLFQKLYWPKAVRQVEHAVPPMPHGRHTMTEALQNIIARNRAGRRVAIVSVCSAQPDVLRASIAMAQRLDRQVVIEATSNQVNQDGGYTGTCTGLGRADGNAAYSDCPFTFWRPTGDPYPDWGTIMRERIIIR